jgi:hypothetical protein
MEEVMPEEVHPPPLALTMVQAPQKVCFPAAAEHGDEEQYVISFGSRGFMQMIQGLLSSV